MKKISIFLLAISSLFVVSCDKDFEELNQDPNNPTEIPAHLLLGNMVRNQQNAIYNTFVGADMGLCWSQQWSKVQYNDEERYIPRRPSIDLLWGGGGLNAGTSGIYTSVLLESKDMETLAIAEGNTNLQAISLILRANGFQILTDMFGPIPFNEALNPNNTKPAYDSQEAVYDGILALLNQADAILANGSGAVPATSDLVYGGNMAKWKKFAGALKLKALMRISKKRNVSAEVQALVNSGNLMASNADSAQLMYLGSQPDANPIYETIVFGTRAEYKVSSVLVDKLNTLNDPRLPVYAQKNNAGNYVGNIPGEENSNNYNGFSSPGTRYLAPTLPGVILSFAQQQLFLAEAANEGYIAGGVTAARDYYFSGITANNVENGVSATDAATYIAQPSIDFSTLVDGRQKIAEQMWIALYGQGLEAWTEWRRTGFPVLSPVVQAAETSIPTRFYFPSNEVSLNRANYQSASATLDNGDVLTSKLWFQP